MALRPKPVKEDIVKMSNVAIKKADFIAVNNLPITKEFEGAVDIMLETAYDKGYHDARSHYNIDNLNPPMDKGF